jgi:hypothetical protein
MDTATQAADVPKQGGKAPGPKRYQAWHVLVAPTQVFSSAMLGDAWLSPLISIWLMLLAAQLVSIQSATDLLQHSGLNVTAAMPGWLQFSWQAALLVIGVVVFTAGAALLAWLAAMLAGLKLSYPRVFVWMAYGLQPALLGLLLGYFSFAITHPLTRQAEHALALLVKPFSLNLALFLGNSFQPLSLGWVFASYIDVFGIWSLVVLAIGAHRFLGITGLRLLWFMLALVLMLLLVLVAWWQLLQGLV